MAEEVFSFAGEGGGDAASAQQSLDFPFHATESQFGVNSQAKVMISVCLCQASFSSSQLHLKCTARIIAVRRCCSLIIAAVTLIPLYYSLEINNKERRNIGFS